MKIKEKRRNTVRYKRGKLARNWLIGLLFLPFTFLGIFCLFKAIDLTLADLFGTNTTAEVLSHQIDTDSDNGSTYNITYRFQSGGIDFEKTAGVTQHDYKLLEDGQRVGVRYLPGREKDATKLSDPRLETSETFFSWVIAVFWNSVAVVVGVVIYANQKRQMKLVRYGESVEGEICGLNVEPSGEDDVYRVAYQFRPTGTYPITRTMKVSKAEFEKARVGQKVRVCFDKENTANSILYEYSDFVVSSGRK
jgi:hypothetical protein